MRKHKFTAATVCSEPQWGMCFLGQAQNKWYCSLFYYISILIGKTQKLVSGKPHMCQVSNLIYPSLPVFIPVNPLSKGVLITVKRFQPLLLNLIYLPVITAVRNNVNLFWICSARVYTCQPIVKRCSDFCQKVSTSTTCPWWQLSAHFQKKYDGCTKEYKIKQITLFFARCYNC